MSENILKEVVTRTNGEMYLGVVGPVRSGKSTFIRRFMELKVLPFIKDENLYQKVIDELPQSGEGKNIMTVEPKFVPTNNMTINVLENLNINIRLVDCVGYIISDAKGYLNDDGSKRLVHTPWFSEAIPFEDAAAIGTKKVIESHSNIGVLITSDGSFGEFSRNDYSLVEEEMVEELKKLDKPFVIVLNSIIPTDPKTIELCSALEEKYQTSVVSVDVNKMTDDDVEKILKLSLSEFNISELNIGLPNWINELDDESSFKNEFDSIIKDATKDYRKMKDVFLIREKLASCKYLNKVEITNIASGEGRVDFDISVDDSIYKDIVEEILGEKITNKASFLKTIQELKKAKTTFERVGNLEKVDRVGYDLITPPFSLIELEAPSLLKQATRYGVSLNAKADVLLISKITINSSFEPIIGDESQAQGLVDFMNKKYQEDPKSLWETEIFGKKLKDVISDGMKFKLNQVPDEILYKYKEGITKVIDKARGGVIAIIL